MALDDIRKYRVSGDLENLEMSGNVEESLKGQEKDSEFPENSESQRIFENIEPHTNYLALSKILRLLRMLELQATSSETQNIGLERSEKSHRKVREFFGLRRLDTLKYITELLMQCKVEF